jgi:hypothetical protein
MEDTSMRQKTETKTLYTFDELSDDAKERARDWYRESMDFADFGADSVLEDAARIADIIGIQLRTRAVKLMGGGTRQEPNIYWSIANRSDDGVTFDGSYSYAKGSVRKLEAEAPSTYDGKPQAGNAEVNRIARELANVQKRNFYQVQASIGHGRSLYSGVTVDAERADGKPMNSEDDSTVRECMCDFATWIHRQLEAEYEYQNSDEQVDDAIRANEYEFDEDGNRA